MTRDHLISERTVLMTVNTTTNVPSQTPEPGRWPYPTDLELEQQELDYLGLPVAFQRRIDRFRSANPSFRQHFEAYELNCCTQAVLIAERLGTPEAVERFYELRSWEEQKRRVPGLDPGHSGNSLAVACRLAWTYLRAPYLVEYEHGALAPLVGCETYGCRHPRPSAA